MKLFRYHSFLYKLQKKYENTLPLDGELGFLAVTGKICIVFSFLDFILNLKETSVFCFTLVRWGSSEIGCLRFSSLASRMRLGRVGDRAKNGIFATLVKNGQRSGCGWANARAGRFELYDDILHPVSSSWHRNAVDCSQKWIFKPFTRLDRLGVETLQGFVFILMRQALKSLNHYINKRSP